MKSSSSTAPLVLGRGVRLNGLQMPPTAQALVLVAHPDAASRRLVGHRFVADVLHANGFATLPFNLHTPEEEARGVAPPGMVQTKLRVRGVFDWLLTQPGLGGRPVALLGVGDAVPGCIAAVARRKPPALRSMVLLDGRPDKVVHHLAHLSLPTLFVLGQCDARLLARQRLALRDIPAGHRLEMLSLPTLPRPAAGALEAFACLALDWMDRSLVRADAAAGGVGRASIRVSAGLDETVPASTGSLQSTAAA